MVSETLAHPTLALLERSLFGDLFQSLNINPSGQLASLTRLAMRPSARRFCRYLLTVDRILGEGDFRLAIHHALDTLTSGVSCHGTASIPTSGPLLAVANHAGAADFLAAAACIGRPDIHIIAGMRPVFDHLPNIRRLVIPLDRNATNRMGAMRQVIDLLRQSRAVLIFPHGFLEPDPALQLPDALTALGNWSRSVGVFLKKVPQAALQPLVIRNAVSPRAFRSVITRFGRTPKRRAQLAMIQQMARPFMSFWPDVMKTRIQVLSGSPASLTDLSGTADLDQITRSIEKLMTDLMLDSARSAEGYRPEG